MNKWERKAMLGSKGRGQRFSASERAFMRCLIRDTIAKALERVKQELPGFIE